MPFDFSPASLTHAIGAAVLHFVWQGAAVGVLAAAVLAIIPRRRAHARYLTACGAMSLCLLLFIGTVLLGVVSVQSASGAPSLSEDFLAAAVWTTAGATVDSARMIDTIAWVYLGGVVFFAIRFGTQWLVAKRLTLRGVSQPDETWREIFESLKRDLGVSAKVRLLRSGLAEVPMVVGWISPVVLVPVSAFTSLSPDQLRAVLTHELAHVRRHDHLFNAVQLAVEAVLFFHPVTWWLSKQVRAEREHCCDDATVRTAVNPRVFAEALAQLELVRNSQHQAALAATGGPLMDRIARILGVNARPRRTPAWRCGIAIAAGALVAAAGMTHAATKDPEPRNAEVLRMLQQIATVSGADDQQIRDLYDMFVFSGSATDLRMDEHLVGMRARIDAALQSGDLTPAEAAERIASVEREIDIKADMQFLQDVFMYTPGEAYLALSEERMEAAVRRGELTPDEAARKMADLERSVDLREEHGEAVKAKDAELDAMVESGEITREQAGERLKAFERGMKARYEFRAASEKLDAMVESGEITREQADQRLATMRERMSARGERVDWEALKVRVEGAVDRGELTREEADRIYVGMRERAAESGSDQMERRIAGAIIDLGVERESVRPVMGVMKRGIEAMKIDDEAERAAAFNTLRDYMTNELGLTVQQIDGIERLGRRAATFYESEQKTRSAGEEKGEMAEYDRLAPALYNDGIPRENMRTAVAAVEKIAGEMRVEGRDFDLNPRITAWLDEEGFTADHVRIVTRFARQVADSGR